MKWQGLPGSGNVQDRRGDGHGTAPPMRPGDYRQKQAVKPIPRRASCQPWRITGGGSEVSHVLA